MKLYLVIPLEYLNKKDPNFQFKAEDILRSLQEHNRLDSWAISSLDLANMTIENSFIEKEGT